MRQFKYWMKKNKRNKACVCLHYWRCQKGNCSCSDEEPTPIINVDTIGAPSTNSVSLTVGGEPGNVTFSYTPTDASQVDSDVTIQSSASDVALGSISTYADGTAELVIEPVGAGTATITYTLGNSSYDIAVTVEPNYNYTLGVNYNSDRDYYTYHVAQTIPTRSTRGRKKAAGVVEEYYFSIDAPSTPTWADISQESGSGISAKIFNMDYALQIKARSEAAIQAGTQEAAKDIFNEYKKLYADELETTYYYEINVDERESEVEYVYAIVKKQKSDGDIIGWYSLATNPGATITEARISSHEDSIVLDITDLSDAEALKAEILNAKSEYRYGDQAYAYGGVVYNKYNQDSRNVKSIKEDTITLDELTK